MTSIVVGLIGVGRIGAMHAANLLATSGDDVELVVADVDAARAERVAAALGCEAASSVDALFARRPHGIVIAVGTSHHAPLILRAIDAGIPVFCEKPVAESTAASQPVLEAVERTGAVVQIGHQRRLDSGHLEAKRAYGAGELGWLHTIRAVTADSFPPPVEFIAASGGLFRDCSVHDFDSLQWLTGQRIVEVMARGSNNGDPAIAAVGDVDSATALAVFEDGTIAAVSATRYNGAGHDVRLELQGSLASLHVGLDASYSARSAEPHFEYPAATPHRTFHDRFAAAYREEMRAFVRLVREQGPNPCTVAEAIDASRIADAAQLSLTTGVAQKVQR